MLYDLVIRYMYIICSIVTDQGIDEHDIHDIGVCMSMI